MPAHACHEVRAEKPQSDASYASRCIAANLRLIVDGAHGCCSRAIRYRVTIVLLKASRGNVLRHGEAHATKGLNAFGTSLSRNSLSLRAAGAIRSGCNGCGQRFRWRDLICGLIEPGFETRLAESRAIAGKECALAKLHAVVKRVRVCDNLARILACG